jgi:hypothetical protein
MFRRNAYNIRARISSRVRTALHSGQHMIAQVPDPLNWSPWPNGSEGSELRRSSVCH